MRSLKPFLLKEFQGGTGGRERNNSCARFEISEVSREEGKGGEGTVRRDINGIPNLKESLKIRASIRRCAGRILYLVATELSCDATYTVV